MKADTQIEPLFRQRTHRKKKEEKKNNLAWDNVSHAQCDECLLTGALTDDLYRDTTLLRRPPAPEAGTTWKNWPPWNPFHHAWRSLKSVGSFCPLCQDGVGRSGGGGGWQSSMDHCIPGIAESSLIVSSMLLSVSLHPSSLWSQTVLPLRSGRRRDRWACMQTDRAVLYIRAPLSFHAMSQQVLP